MMRKATATLERVLEEQPFVKEDKVTVGKFASSNGMKLKEFVHWELGADTDA